MDRDDERRIVITVHPRSSDEEMLNVADALQQVLDYLKVVEAAGRVMSKDEVIDWKLESASTNSPFTVVAVACPRNPAVDAAPIAALARRETARAFRQIRDEKLVPAWLSDEARGAMRSLLQRSLASVGTTVARADQADTESVEISSETAKADLGALSPLPLVSNEVDIPARRITGEITGHMTGVGRYRRNPALTILTPLYGAVPCSVPAGLIRELGGERTLEDVWKGRSVAVFGTLIYAPGGKLQRVIAQAIRDREAAPIDIEAVYDSDFTDGLDPAEYLDRLHGGSLA